MSDQAAKVNQYYDSTKFEYEHFWARGSQAIHFGYFDQSTKGHQLALLKMNEILAGIAGVQPSDMVLDAGCGYGAVPFGSSAILAATWLE
jgi:cyclopropane fatty-acyl-phospholipid synthase-like methyltransferase